MTQFNRSAAERLHGLDALRGGLLLLGVVQHATAPFVPLDQYWVVRDVNQAAEIGWLSFVIHVFRMTAFFVLAGLFARMSVHRLGVLGFARDRLRRIVLPLVIGWFAVIPAMLALSDWALTRSYGPDDAPSALASPATISLGNVPLQHLWFLYMLSLLCAAIVVVKLVMKKVDSHSYLSTMANRFARFVLKTPLAVVLVSIPATLLLGSMAGWTVSVGIPTPNVGLFYVVRPLLVYGAAFAVGWAMHRQFDLAEKWVRWWPWNLAMAIVLSLVCLQLTAFNLLGPPNPSRWVSLGEAALYAFAGWAWTFALIGGSLRFLSRPSATRRYLADSSYWIYLVHPPLALWLGDAMRTLDWPAPLKLILTVSITMLLLLASYQVFVRHSVIGAVLNGKRPQGTRLRPAQAH